MSWSVSVCGRRPAIERKVRETLAAARKHTPPPIIDGVEAAVMGALTAVAGPDLVYELECSGHASSDVGSLTLKIRTLPFAS